MSSFARTYGAFETAGNWAPKVSSGLIGHWHAFSGLSLDGSNRVQQWDNLVSPSGGASYLEDHPVLGSATAPTYQATGWNSTKPTLSYSPIKRVQNTTNSQLIGFGLDSGKRTIAAVINVNSTALSKFLLQWTDEFDDFYAIYFDAGTQNLIVDVNNGVPVSTGVSFTGACTFVLSRNGGNHILWKDGVQVATPSILVNAGGATEMFVGTDANGANGFSGLLCELCLWTEEHNNIGAAFHRYAKRKYGNLP